MIKNDESEEVKRCSKCKVRKPTSEFSKDKNRKDNLYVYCKDCVKKLNHKHKDVISTRRKQYYWAHREVALEKNKRYNDLHKKEKVIYDKQHYQNTKIEKEAYAKQYRQDNRLKLATKAKLYFQTEKGKNVKRKVQYKRRVLKYDGIYEAFNFKEIFERDEYICQLCGIKTRPDYKNSNHPLYPNLDHIIPLSKGGAHTRLNTQCLCRQCNLEKSNIYVNDQLRIFG